MDILFHSPTFAAVTHWVVSQGYWIILIAMLIEGPIVTAAAAFGVAMGYFNFGAIFILSLLGDVLADVAYYALGYWGRMALVEKFGHKVGLSKERLMRMEKLLHEHAWRTLLALKLTPILPTPGLMLVGATKMPLRKFTTISLLITLPKSLLFMLIGYYFGKAYDQIARYISNGTYVILAIIAAVILIDRLFRKYSARLGQKLEQL